MRKMIDFVALAGAIIGSFLIAINVSLGFLGYAFFMASSLASLYLLLKVAQNVPTVLVYQNMYFVLVNFVGLVRHF